MTAMEKIDFVSNKITLPPLAENEKSPAAMPGFFYSRNFQYS